jgi:hypothetical protein
MVTGQDHPSVTKLWNLDRQPNIYYEIEIKKYFRMKDKSANYKMKFITRRLKEQNIK